MNVTSKQRPIIIAASIFVLAFMMRLIFNVTLREHYPFYDFPSSDVSYYLSWGRSIALGVWDEQSQYLGLPLFPHFLAILYRLSLGKIFALRVIIMLIGSLNCVLIYLIARRLFSDRIALLAGILTAVSFTCVYYDWLMMPPVLLVFLGAVIILSLLEHEKLTTKHWLVLGLLLGTALLGDGKFLFFSAFLLIYLFVTNKNRKDTLSRMILPLLCGLLIMLGLSAVRNKIVLGEWIAISPQSGLSLYAGNNPQANGYFENPEDIRPTHFGQDADQILIAQQETGKELTPKAVSIFYRNKAIDFIVNDSAAFLRLLPKKAVHFFNETERAQDMDLIFLRELKWRLDVNPVSLIWPLAVVGMIVSWRVPKAKLIILLIASQLIIVLVFFFLNRFRASIIPFLIIYEAYALDWLVGQWRARRWPSVALTLAGIFIALCFNKPQPIDAAAYDHLYFSKMGFILEKKEDLPAARQAYEKALALQPSDTTLLFNLGNVHLAMKEFQKAQHYYLKAVEINPLLVDAYVNLGYAYESAGEAQRAIAAYQQALKLSPESNDILYQLALLNIQEGDCLRAEKYIDEISKREERLADELHIRLDTCISK